MNRLRLAGIPASAALVLAAVVLGVMGSGGGSDDAPGARSRVVAVEDLTALEATLGHPIYWVGERPPDELELTRQTDGSVYLRYLPEGVEAGDSRQLRLTVGTYPVAGAVAALRRTAAGDRLPLRRLQSGAVLLADPASPRSAYLAFPESALQIEVYDPEPGRALELVQAGAVRPVG